MHFPKTKLNHGGEYKLEMTLLNKDVEKNMYLKKCAVRNFSSSFKENLVKELGQNEGVS